MKKTISILSCVILSLVFISQTFAADVAKIGVIDFKEIIQQSAAGKMVSKQLGDKQKELVDKINAERTQFNEFSKNFEREKLVLSEEQIREKERTGRIKYNDLKKLQEDSTNELKKLEFELITKIQQKVTEISSEIGKTQGFLLILEKSSSGVIYSPDHIDITDKVIKAYNLEMAKIKQ